MPDVMKELLRFNRAWKKLACIGQCDAFGGAEYKRLRSLWLDSGCPPPRQWIRAEANRPPAAPSTQT